MTNISFTSNVAYTYFMNYIYKPLKINQEYVYMYCFYLVALFRKKVLEYIDKFNRNSMPYHVYKVYAYPADELKNRRDISNDYFDGFTIVPSKAFPRIEYRCIWKSKKYKVNSIQYFGHTPTEIVEENIIPILLPSIQKTNDPCLSTFTRKQVKNFIVQALMFDSERITDVTKRLLKFAGPNQDFFEQPILTKWILKTHLYEQSFLQIMYSNGKLVKYTMSEEILIEA